MRRSTRLLSLSAAFVLLAGGACWLAFALELRELQSRLERSRAIVSTAHGPLAYASGGEGFAVLVVHGAGGGHDQGRLLAEAFLPPHARWLAPSRFGYLDSPLPAEPSTAAQADAFAELLDALDIERVVVLAMSGGVPPALQFALRHPQRTRALLLLSLAPYAPLTAEAQALPVPLWLYDALFASDFPYWALSRLAPGRLAALFDARPELRPAMTASEQAFLRAMIDAFLPVTARRDGLRNEGAAIDPADAIDPARIAVPTLIVHARDDRITPFATAEFTAARVLGAELLALETGGHLLLGHHDAVRARIANTLSTVLATELP